MSDMIDLSGGDWLPGGCSTDLSSHRGLSLKFVRINDQTGLGLHQPTPEQEKPLIRQEAQRSSITETPPAVNENISFTRRVNDQITKKRNKKYRGWKPEGELKTPRS